MEASRLKIPDEYYDEQPTRIIGDAFLFNNTTDVSKLEPYVGLLCTVEGAEHYRKGATNTRATFCNNLVKEYIKGRIRNPFTFLLLNREVKSFNQFCVRCFGRWRGKSIYLCKTAFQFEKMCEVFFREIGIKEWKELSHHLAQVLEYDNRYRLTVQDITTECDIRAMYRNPRKELKRLWEVYKEREVPYVAEKNEKVLKLILWLLLIPKYKKAFMKSLVYLKGMSYDDSDYYWTCTVSEYKFGGLTREERAEGRTLPALFTLDEKGVVVKL